MINSLEFYLAKQFLHEASLTESNLLTISQHIPQSRLIYRFLIRSNDIKSNRIIPAINRATSLLVRRVKLSKERISSFFSLRHRGTRTQPKVLLRARRRKYARSMPAKISYRRIQQLVESPAFSPIIWNVAGWPRPVSTHKTRNNSWSEPPPLPPCSDNIRLGVGGGGNRAQERKTKGGYVINSQFPYYG